MTEPADRPAPRPITRRSALGRAARLGAGAYALGSLPLLARCAPAMGRERPNIVFIFSDDHATQAISAYGSRINQTPSIDRIANEGVVFLNSFPTNSICAPRTNPARTAGDLPDCRASPRGSSLAHDPPILQHLLHVLLEEELLDVHHVDLAALDVGLLDIAGHIERGSRGDEERRLLAGLQ